MIIVLALSAD